MALQNNPNATPVPVNEPLVISLITEELKSRKFFNTLQQLGLENSHYQPHLDEVILACLGLTDQTNETFDFYSAVMDEHAQKIGTQDESVREQAAAVHKILSGRTAGPGSTRM